MQNIYVVDGGVGKNVLFSSFINDLYNRDNAKPIIMATFPQIFENHPLVERSVNVNEPGFYDEVIKDHEGEVYFTNPYYSSFVKGKTHVLYEWAKQLGLEFKGQLPELYIDSFAMSEAERFKKEKGDFIIVQFSGGQSPYEMNPKVPFLNRGMTRNYPYAYAQEVVNLIKEKHPDLTIVNFAFENEPTYNLKDCIRINSSFMLYIALLFECKTYISIDSCLMHFAANKFNKKRGICLWGSTGREHFGYDHNINMSNTETHSFRPLPCKLGDTYKSDGSLYLANDEDSILVKPELIVDSLKRCIMYNDSFTYNKEDFVIETKKSNNIIELTKKSQDIFNNLLAQVNTLNRTYQTLIDSHVAALGKDGRYSLSPDRTKLIKVG